MRRLNSTEMRVIDGGRYAYCPVCGKKKNIGWSLSVLFYGWNSVIQQEEGKAALRHAYGKKCW